MGLTMDNELPAGVLTLFERCRQMEKLMEASADSPTERGRRAYLQAQSMYQGMMDVFEEWVIEDVDEDLTISCLSMRNAYRGWKVLTERDESREKMEKEIRA